MFLFDNQENPSAFLGPQLIVVFPFGEPRGFSRGPIANDGLVTAPVNYIVIYFHPNGTAADFTQTLKLEVGHQVDLFHSVWSKSAYMNDLVHQDWATFDALNTCTVFASVSGVCSGGTVTPAYAGKLNHAILQSKLGYIFPSNATAQWLEMWAELYAISAGGGTIPASDSFLNNYFKCTKEFITSMYQSGTPPTTYTTANGCSVPADPLP